MLDVNSLPASVAHRSARAFAHYCLWTMRAAPVHIETEANMPHGPAVVAGWHAANLLALSVHYYYFWHLKALSFYPPGLVGAGMRGQLEGFGQQPVALPADNSGNASAAIKHMLRALADGQLVVVAVDGPHGPALRVRPGAPWLARASGRPLIPTGFAARPALRWPRWDRQIIPLPGMRLAAIFGTPVFVERRREIDATLLEELGAAIAQATRRAWEVVGGRPAAVAPSTLPRRAQQNAPGAT